MQVLHDAGGGAVDKCRRPVPVAGRLYNSVVRSTFVLFWHCKRTRKPEQPGCSVTSLFIVKKALGEWGARHFDWITRSLIRCRGGVYCGVWNLLTCFVLRMDHCRRVNSQRQHRSLESRQTCIHRFHWTFCGKATLYTHKFFEDSIPTSINPRLASTLEGLL